MVGDNGLQGNEMSKHQVAGKWIMSYIIYLVSWVEFFAKYDKCPHCGKDAQTIERFKRFTGIIATHERQLMKKMFK